MSCHTPLYIPDAEVFGRTRPISLAAVVACVEANLTGTVLRDTLSAFRVLSARADLDLTSTLATAAAVREVFGSFSGASLNVSPKRFANIQSLIVGAVRQFGTGRTRTTEEIPLDKHWEELLNMARRREHRWGLSRLAYYCTVKGIRPERVTPQTLHGLHDALEAESLVKTPRGILKQTIAIWNACQRTVSEWPQIVLSSPFKSDPYMLPLSEFPESFRSDVAAWEARMLQPDPLDVHAPLRALRPPTLQSYRFAFRRVASALVRRQQLTVDQIISLEVLCTAENLREGLRPFLPAPGGDTGYVHKMAIQMRNVARHHLKLGTAQVDALTALVARLAPPNAGVMGRRNRSRLSQFDDAAVVQRLLRFPEEEYARAEKLKNPLRQAKGIERALAISLLIFSGVRVKNLRNLRLDRNVARRGGRVFLNFADAEMKSGSALELELPIDTIRLLDIFLLHRGTIPGAQGLYLFPSPNGGARSYSAMREAVSKPLLKHAGIALSPHLYRHIIAKIVAEREPGMLGDLSRRLGHKSINTTYQAYLGTETPAASRRINQLLQQTRVEPELRPVP